jgi:hypothetical protein
LIGRVEARFDASGNVEGRSGPRIAHPAGVFNCHASKTYGSGPDTHHQKARYSVKPQNSISRFKRFTHSVCHDGIKAERRNESECNYPGSKYHLSGVHSLHVYEQRQKANEKQYVFTILCRQQKAAGNRDPP